RSVPPPPSSSLSYARPARYTDPWRPPSSLRPFRQTRSSTASSEDATLSTSISPGRSRGSSHTVIHGSATHTTGTAHETARGRAPESRPAEAERSRRAYRVEGSATDATPVQCLLGPRGDGFALADPDSAEVRENRPVVLVARRVAELRFAPHL